MDYGRWLGGLVEKHSLDTGRLTHEHAAPFGNEN